MLGEVINVTDAAFARAVTDADQPVVAAFWSRQSGQDAQLMGVLEATARHYSKSVRVVRLEKADAPNALQRYEIDTLPQFLFFRAGKMVARARGLPSETALRPWVEYLLERGPAPAARKPQPEPKSASARPLVVTDANFEQAVLGSTLPVLVDFWAAWCHPCQMLAPVIERLAADYQGRVAVAKLDVEANPRTAQQYGAMSIPTLVLFNAGREIDRMVGVQPEGLLRDRLNKILQ